MSSAGKPLRRQLRGFDRKAHAGGIDAHHSQRRLGEQQRDQQAERQENRDIRQRIPDLVVDEGDEREGRGSSSPPRGASTKTGKMFAAIPAA